MHKKRKRDTCIYGDHDALVNFQRDVFFPHLLPFFIARKHTQDKAKSLMIHANNPSCYHRKITNFDGTVPFKK